MDKDVGYGWMVFASIVLVLAGFFNFIWGLTALIKDQYFINQFLFANLTFWGWVAIIFGVIAIIAGFALLTKEQWARYFGIVWASLGAIVWFTLIWSAPVLAIIIITAYVLVIYGLGTYGEPDSAAR